MICSLYLLSWLCWALDASLAGALAADFSGMGFFVRLVTLSAGFFAWFALLTFAHLAAVFLAGWFSGRFWPAFVRSVTGVGAVCGMFFYLVSWVMFSRTGHFLGREGFVLFFQNPGQTLLHIRQVEERAILVVFLGAVALVLALRRLHSLISAWFRGRSGRLFFRVTTAWLCVGIAAPTVLSCLPRPAASSGSRLSTLLHYETGPVAYLLLDVLRPLAYRWDRRQWDSQAVSALVLPEKRIVTTEEYLRRVEPGRFSASNIVLILVDSLRADRLVSSGARRQVMPTLDRLAASSSRFPRAFCQSPHSDYADVCTLSSHYPLRSTEHHYYAAMTYPRVLLYDILKPLGYRTAVISSQNEQWGGMNRYLDTGNLDLFYHAGSAGEPTYIEQTDTGFIRDVRLGKLTAGKLEDDTTIDAAVDWIGRNQNSPFFVYMVLENSHFPYRLPAHAKPAFLPAEITFPVSFLGYPKRYLPVMVNRYDNSLRYIDGLLGRLLDQLRRLGIDNRTIVVVTGDTGQAFLEHGKTTHGSSLWNEMLHVPLVFSIPGRPGRQVDMPVEHIDIPPTLLGLLGLPPHPSFQGRDVLRQSADGGRSLFFHVLTDLAAQTAVMDGGHKLIHDWNTDSYAMYDIVNDWAERRSLASEPLLSRLRHRLNRWEQLQLLYYARPEIHRKYYPPNYGNHQK